MFPKSTPKSMAKLWLAPLPVTCALYGIPYTSDSIPSDKTVRPSSAFTCIAKKDQALTGLRLKL